MKSGPHAKHPGLIALCATPALFAAPQALAEHTHEQQMLVLLDSAYVEEQGEWQVETALDVEPDTDIDFILASEIEFGVSDRLQLQASLPYLSTDGGDGVGDLAFGLSYAFLKQSPSAPQLTGVLELIAPTGDAGDGLGLDTWGIEAGLSASKYLGGGFFGHANFEYERFEGVEDHGIDIDISETAFGAGLAHEMTDTAAVTFEFVRAREEESGPGIDEVTYETQGAIGLVFKPAHGFEIGLGAKSRLTGEDRTSGVLQALFEW